MKLTTTKSIQIDYLGVFHPDQEYELTPYQIGYYKHATGLELNQENLPEGVTLRGGKTDEEN